jgi:hypothetical protein
MRAGVMPAGSVTRPGLPPCPSEDSDNCVWDARTMGNGLGRSFVVLEGRLYLEEPADG